ncbi:Piso0_004613 [Millerozyma farinosa CBS 7064]|uniref:Piso0_004613 protein n=1 Tax=Pichia sorbitophila (strain ATCC MYA-4447 / BCRC 22081 / CBS 7064 / NBRC 10061 / NRRL Y-12695) TaxID=559304 RepID=G8Y5Y3_PICSO|nr:Piso0_004613 [Millerozyma farinosa CBS 7064]CCE85044.1 Piso0_004613 [Millerozyma farinosa CBS 7064]
MISFIASNNYDDLEKSGSEFVEEKVPDVYFANGERQDLSEKKARHEQDMRAKRRRWTRFVFFVIVLMSLSATMFIMSDKKAPVAKSAIKPLVVKHSEAHKENGIDRPPCHHREPLLVSRQGKDPQGNQILQVSDTNMPPTWYGAPVYSTLLHNHTFGNSWNSPSVATIKPPQGVSFNRVVLTLNTTVSGVQFDRLGHIFLGGVEIWRSSTIEPGGNTVYSTFRKDMTPYVKLFQEENKLVYLLNNVVSSTYTGAFNISLYADYYYVQEDTAQLGFNGSNTADYFDNTKQASRLIPLTAKSDSNQPALVSLSAQDSIEVNLPSVPKNTTRLTLSITTSGNGDEEFWYTNVLDKFRTVFNQSFFGHGPLRVVDVYYNGTKVGAQAPQPVIFTGGISPALWSPVVSISAFNLPTVDIDLTALLPNLWNLNAGENQKIKIVVSNGLDDATGGKSGIGSNWLTSAHLQTFENSQVVDSAGSIDSFMNSSSGYGLGVTAPYDTLLQVVRYASHVQIKSSLEFKLKNGNDLKTSFTSISDTFAANVQRYANKSATQDTYSFGQAVSSSTFVDQKQGSSSGGNSSSVLYHSNRTGSYPLGVLLGETTLPDGSKMNVGIAYGKLVDLNSTPFNLSLGISQIGRTQDYGQTNTTYNLTLSGEHGKAVFNRKVKAAHGNILSDESDSKTDSGVKGLLSSYDDKIKYDIAAPSKGTTFGKVQQTHEQLLGTAWYLQDNLTNDLINTAMKELESYYQNNQNQISSNGASDGNSQDPSVVVSISENSPKFKNNLYAMRAQRNAESH